MAFKSLGERLGFVSAGDVRRARERQIREESEKRGEIRGEKRGREQERAKADAEHLQEKLSAARDLILQGVPREVASKSLKLTKEQVANL